MHFEEFRALWNEVLSASPLRPPGGPVFAEQTLDLDSLDRQYAIRVEPAHGQDAPPFYVSAELSWRWDALTTARTRSTEEDMLASLLGAHPRGKPRTESPWMRIDVRLDATVSTETPRLNPTPAAWAEWSEEVRTRLDRISPLVPDDRIRVKRGRVEAILAWQGDPVVESTCGADGTLVLRAVSVEAWQALRLPRQLDVGEDKGLHPARDLGQLFRRTAAGLHAWMEALDHLRPKRAAR